jgi:hypothetical protein
VPQGAWNMITVEQYAQRNRISENSARKRLQRKVLEGYMFKMRGPDNRFVYHDKPLVTIKWHDPFNRIKDCKPKTEVLET